MQQSNGSVNGAYHMTGRHLKYNMQTNQNLIGRMHNSIQREDFSAGLSSVPGVSSSSSADVMNQMMNNNSQLSHEATNDDVPLDDILRELLEEQSNLNLVKTSQKWSPTVASSVRDTTVTEAGNARPLTSWQMSQSRPTRSEVISKEAISRSSPYSPDETSSMQRSCLPTGGTGTLRSSPDVTNKWGLSKPRMWTCEDRKKEERKPEALLASESPEQRMVSFQNQELPKSAPATRFRGPERQLSSKGPVQFFPSSREEYHSRPHDTLTRSKSSGYRNCASDSEDPMSWLEEQHSKLRMRRDGTIWRQRSQQEKKLLSELKTAQNTLRLHKRSQSDTEDTTADDIRANSVDGQTLRQVRENISNFDKFGPRVQFSRDLIQTNGSVVEGVQGRTDQTKIRDSGASRQTEPVRHELPKRYPTAAIQNGQASWQSSQSNGSTSPVTPKIGDSCREVVLQALENNFTMKGEDTPSLDEVERSLILTLESLSRSKQVQKANDTELQQQRLTTADVRSLQHQKVEHSPVSAAKPCLNPDQQELQEVIELKPIGQGVRNLEPANGAKSPPASYPVQVVVSPFQLSPVTPYDNQGMSTVRRPLASSMSVPLSHAATVNRDGSTSPSSASTISQKPDIMTFDVAQQQQLIRQKLFQQQLKQQQLQQQLQQLQQLQQQHQLIQQQLQEQRQHQQQIQQQQQQIEPRVQQHMVQQQQLLEQQLLQQQQQLLMLQQQLQMQQMQQQTEQELQDHQALSQSFSDNGRVRTSPKQYNADSSQDGHRMLFETQQFQQQVKPALPFNSEKGTDMQQQQLWHVPKDGRGLQQSIVQRENNTLQQKSNFLPQQYQDNAFSAGMDCSASQTLGQTLSAQQADSFSKQQSEFTISHVHPLSHQHLPPVVPLSGQQKNIVEEVIQKVHVAVSGGDRGIPALESVLGHQENKTAQSYAHQQASQWTTGTANDRAVLSGLAIDTAVSAQGLQRSPSSSAGSGQSLQSPKQAIRTACGHSTVQRTFSGPASPSSVLSRDDSLTSNVDGMDGGSQMPRFVRDTSQLWHKPNFTREDVITFLKDKTPGSFIIRNSNTFQGAFGLAIKVAQIPPNVQPRSGDLEAELVRHFLIESTPRGVRLKGCSNEPTFGSLTALVYQHTITPLALPCKLILPELGVLDAASADAKSPGPANNDAQLAGANVLYISSTDLESLTGPEAITRAIEQTFGSDKTPPKITEVHFKVTSLGITLTDNKRRLFFRRHYPFNTITHCSLDNKDRRWKVKDDNDKAMSTGRVFGFVARKIGSNTENTCHLFSELDPTQPATAIVNFVTKVMISSESAAQT